MTPQELKNSILQLAIQGKLVEQRAEEGTAEELYREIQAEKQKLIKEGKIKKDKPLPDITDNEKPFDIPESWKWVRFGDLFEIGSAIRIHQSDWKTEGIPFLRGRELVKLSKTGKPDAEIFISPELYETNKEKGGIPQKEDLLVTAVGTLGKVYIVKGTHPFYYKDAYILHYNNYASLFSPYYKMMVESPFIQEFIAKGSMGTTVAQLTIQKANGMLCALPPLAEQKRIVAKIEELLPLIDHYEQAWSKLEDFNKRFPTDMQKSLLQMAIQGKLVEQRPEEGTGEELYRDIQAEKHKLIKEGKIKGGKPLPDITDNEKPFDIPESWKWVRLGECSTYASSKEKISPSDISAEMWSLDLEDIEKETGRIINHCSATERKITGDKVIFHKGQILYSKLRPYLKKILVAPDDGICTPELVPFNMIGPFDNSYIIFVLKSPHIDFTINSVTYGVKMPRVGTDTMVNLLIPLPPLAEQKRIVEKLNQLLPLGERLKGG